MTEPPRKKRRVMEWTDRYSEYLVEIEMPQSDGEHDERWDEQYPESVTFCNLQGFKQKYLVKNEITDRTDVLAKLYKLNDFNWTITTDWSVLRNLLEESRFTKPGHKSTKVSWQCGKAVHVGFNEPLEMVWDLLVKAFKTDFCNADIKYFMTKICEHILERVDPQPDFIVVQPFSTHATNSRVISIGQPHVYNRRDMSVSPSFSTASSSSTGSRTTKEKGIVVPDVIVIHKYEQFFVLNFECKRSVDNFNKGTLQCMKQMLSQMHDPQNMHFGIVLSPMQWQLMVMLKTPSGIEVLQSREDLYTISREDADIRNFNIDSFVRLLDWIYKIISFCAKHKTSN